MSLAIWKFPLIVEDVQEVLIPLPATILSVSEQCDMPVLYAVVQTPVPEDREKWRKVRIFIRGTGHDLGEAADQAFLGTVKTIGGRLMWHVFAARQPWDSGPKSQ